MHRIFIIVAVFQLSPFLLFALDLPDDVKVGSTVQIKSQGQSPETIEIVKIKEGWLTGKRISDGEKILFNICFIETVTIAQTKKSEQ